MRTIETHEIQLNLTASGQQSAAVTVWLTGLPCSGKTTIALGLHECLRRPGKPVRILDGDALRHGISRDLGFAPADRTENVRRVAEIAKLFNEAGVFVISALVSPMHSDRSMARSIIGEDCFFEVYLSAPLAVCEARDVKGMYARARRGDIPYFTGVDAPYEVPQDAHCIIDTANQTVEACIQELYEVLVKNQAKSRPGPREKRA
jgi:adenylylsulfate kinase